MKQRFNLARQTGTEIVLFRENLTYYQTFWLLCNRVINLTTVLVNGKSAIDWIKENPAPKCKIKTHLGPIQHFNSNNPTLTKAAFVKGYKRAENKFAFTL